MKFDRSRNAAELRELLDYLACIAIGTSIAVVLGMSWLLASGIVVIAFRYWKKQGKAFDSRLRVLAVLVCFGLLLGENWAAYREGVSDGYEAASMAGTTRVKQ